jgi:hypothetical protein
MATFTIDVSISSSIAASDTAMATRYLYFVLVDLDDRAGRWTGTVGHLAGRGVGMEGAIVAIGVAYAPLLDVDVRRRPTSPAAAAGPLPQPSVIAMRTGHALHDLREVAGRVVRAAAAANFAPVAALTLSTLPFAEHPPYASTSSSTG